MSRLANLFSRKSKGILNIYLTAGYPNLNNTVEIVRELEAAGVDMIELGMPFSDPLADGPTIQSSSKLALDNGMTMGLLFDQVKEIRKFSEMPIIWMGYLNPIMQYGVEPFLAAASEAGIDGFIIPDLPMEIYEESYQSLFEEYEMKISFLVTPQTSDARIRQADRLSSAFLYVVSQASITGKKADMQSSQLAYFQRLCNLDLDSPRLIGFGIHDKASFDAVQAYANGGIIGSAFIRSLEETNDINKAARNFVKNIV